MARREIGFCGTSNAELRIQNTGTARPSSQYSRDSKRKNSSCTFNSQTMWVEPDKGHKSTACNHLQHGNAGYQRCPSLPPKHTDHHHRQPIHHKDAQQFAAEPTPSTCTSQVGKSTAKLLWRKPSAQASPHATECQCKYMKAEGSLGTFKVLCAQNSNKC
jgi:hypothetical protein